MATAEHTNALLAAIVASSDDAIIGKDLNGIVTSWNRAAEKIFGFTAEEMIGQPITRIIPPERLAEEQEIIGRIRRGEKVEHYDTVRLRKDGEPIDIAVTISPIWDAEGRVVGASKIARDVRAQKQVAAALARQTQELERSNRDLEQFAYVASHDLQEPLRAVAGCVSLLKKRYEGKLDARADEFIAHAVDGATRMQKLIQDLLEFSRVGTRGNPLATVDLAEPLQAALKNLAVTMKESGAVVTHDALPAVVGDAAQLTQLFQNLIGNAIKFHGRAPPAVHLSAEAKGSEWVVQVRDNGIGIEAQYFERIFGIFQRLHTRDEYPGTGIGLALCKRIIERHGGRIWVESTPGQGSAFFFTLRQPKA